jgi:hypothetical protein
MVLAAAAFLAVAPAQAQRTVTMMAGGQEVVVAEGTPRDAAGNPVAQGRNNCRKRAVWVAERPYRSTFAAVAAQEIYEKQSCVGLVKLDKRHIELVSHAITVIVGVGVIGERNLGRVIGHKDDPACKPNACTAYNFYQMHARKMRGYPWLRDLSEGEILELMLSAPIQREARDWIRRNGRTIADLKAFRFPRSG